MNLRLFLLTAIIGLLGFAMSCTDEATLNPGNDNNANPEVPEGKALLKLTFQGLSNSPKSYADDLTGTDAENRVESVKLFFFDSAKGDTLVNVYTVTPSQDSIGVGQTPGKESTLMVTETSAAMNIIAIANPTVVRQEWLSQIGVITYADFKNMTTLAQDSMPKPALLMTALGYKKGESNVTNIDITTGSTANVVFDLYRSVARIDIVNRDSVAEPEADAQKHKFVLQTARLVNIPSNTWLYNTTGYSEAPSSASYLKELAFETLDPSDGSTGTMNSQLYMYPMQSVSEASNETKLEVTGLYNGVSARYTIPFGTRDIKANNRYVVTLDSISPATLKATIEMADWATDTIKFKPEQHQAPTVELDTTGFGAAGITFKEGTNGVDTITAGYAAAVLNFTVKATTTSPVFATDADWITKQSETNLKSYADTAFIKKYGIAVAYNNYGRERNNLIHFINPAKPTERKTIFVKMNHAWNEMVTGANNGDVDWATALTSCPEGYRLPTANEFLAILPPTHIVGAWSYAGGITVAAEGTGTSITAETGPGYYITGNTLPDYDGTDSVLYGIKKAGTAEAYALEWEWKPNLGDSLTIRIVFVGTTLGTTATAADIKALLDAGGVATTILTFPNSRNANTRFWSSSENGNNNNHAWNLNARSAYILLGSNNKTDTYGVRCLPEK